MYELTDPRDIISETYGDLDMAEIVDWDKYEEMLYDEMQDEIRSVTVQMDWDDEWMDEEEEDDEYYA